MMKSLHYAYVHRRERKGNFRRLWITRINAATRQAGLSYSRFIQGLRAAGIELDRKILAELAVNSQEEFARLIEVSKAAQEQPAAS